MTDKKSDIEFVRCLMKTNCESLGFIPLKAIKKAYDEKRLLLYYKNSEKIGYLLFGPLKKGKDLTIWQMCIDERKRKKGCAKKLFNRLHAYALKNEVRGIRLRCAVNLTANLFWKSLGFKLISTDPPRGRRRRKINIYYMSLTRLPLFKKGPSL